MTLRWQENEWYVRISRKTHITNFLHKSFKRFNNSFSVLSKTRRKQQPLSNSSSTVKEGWLGRSVTMDICTVFTVIYYY